MSKTDREFARVLRQAAPAPLWSRIVGGAIGFGIVALFGALIAWGLVAAIVGIAGLIGGTQ